MFANTKEGFQLVESGDLAVVRTPSLILQKIFELRGFITKEIVDQILQTLPPILVSQHDITTAYYAADENHFGNEERLDVNSDEGQALLSGVILVRNYIAETLRARGIEVLVLEQGLQELFIADSLDRGARSNRRGIKGDERHTAKIRTVPPPDPSIAPPPSSRAGRISVAPVSILEPEVGAETVYRIWDNEGRLSDIVTIAPALSDSRTLRSAVREKEINASEIINILKVTFKGCQKIHAQGLTHGDINLSNILLNGQLTDFEGAAREDEAGIPSLHSPPFFDGTYYSHKVMSEVTNKDIYRDYFALGMTLVVALLGYDILEKLGQLINTFRRSTNNQRRQLYLFDLLHEEWAKAHLSSKFLEDIVLKMLIADREKRLPPDKILLLLDKFSTPESLYEVAKKHEMPQSVSL